MIQRHCTILVLKTCIGQHPSREDIMLGSHQGHCCLNIIWESYFKLYYSANLKITQSSFYFEWVTLGQPQVHKVEFMYLVYGIENVFRMTY